MPKQRGKARLRVKVYRKDTIAPQCEILSKMRRRGCLPRSALEIHHRDDLELLIVGPPWKVSATATGAGVKMLANLVDGLNRIGPSAAARHIGDTRQLCSHLPQIAFCDSNELCRLGWGKAPDSLFRVWRKYAEVMRLQLRRQGHRMTLDERLKLILLRIGFHSTCHLHLVLPIGRQLRKNHAIALNSADVRSMLDSVLSARK